MSDLVQTLTDGRAALLELGVLQGDLVDKNLRMCSAGALCYVTGMGLTSSLISKKVRLLTREPFETKDSAYFRYQDAVEMLETTAPCYPGRLAIYNDTHTEGEVLDLWDRAILAAKEAANV